VHGPGELFAVLRPPHPGAESSVPFTRAEYEALRRETSVFVDVVAMVRSIETRIEGCPVAGAPWILWRTRPARWSSSRRASWPRQFPPGALPVSIR
jgi:hypothetical protein